MAYKKKTAEVAVDNEQPEEAASVSVEPAVPETAPESESTEGYQPVVFRSTTAIPSSFDLNAKGQKWQGVRNPVDGYVYWAVPPEVADVIEGLWPFQVGHIVRL